MGSALEMIVGVLLLEHPTIAPEHIVFVFFSPQEQPELGVQDKSGKSSDVGDQEVVG